MHIAAWLNITQTDCGATAAWQPFIVMRCFIIVTVADATPVTSETDCLYCVTLVFARQDLI